MIQNKVQKQLGHASTATTANMYTDISFEDIVANQAITMSIQRYSRRRSLMERAEFKWIDQYIEDAEINLEQLDTQNITPERHLTKLHLVIERLMYISGNSEDRHLKSSLTTLEHRARRCMRCIETRHTVRN
jgi:hypothetical protein